jgi:hypothetical protein
MRKIVMMSAMVLIFSHAYCQTSESNKKINWGFNLGLNYANMQVRDVAIGTQHKNAYGFRMGILMDMKLTKHLSFVPKSELSFSDAKIIENASSDNREVYQVYPHVLDFSSHFTYRFKDSETSHYFLFGPTFRLPVKSDEDVQYATLKSDIAIDFGIGLDKKLPYFKVAPEIRYSFGLTNLSGFNTIGKLNFHTMSLVMNLRG